MLLQLAHPPLQVPNQVVLMDEEILELLVLVLVRIVSSLVVAVRLLSHDQYPVA